jgi:hypothetical protein
LAEGKERLFIPALCCLPVPILPPEWQPPADCTFPPPPKPAAPVGDNAAHAAQPDATPPGIEAL